MTATKSFKTVLAGLACAGALALAANAQAVPYNPNQAFGAGYGDAANPAVITVNHPLAEFFQDTINFDLGSFTHFNMTSTTTGLSLWFGASIFENVLDTQVPGGGAMPSFTSFALADLLQPIPPGDYHLHPAGLPGLGGGSYTLTMWGTTAAPVPVPAAVYLFGSGLIGLVGLARRKMSA